MTEEQWKIFVPLYADFRATIEKASSVLFQEDFCYHTPEIYDGVEYYGNNPHVEITTEEYDRCDGTSYYQREISTKAFIDNNFDTELERLAQEREAKRLKEIEEQRLRIERYETEQKAIKYKQYLALKKEFDDE